jgi:ATP-dependent DNA ligase
MATLKPRRSTHRSLARFIARTIDGAKSAAFPGFIDPCRPILRKAPPVGAGWLHEIEHDGYRAQAHFNGRSYVYTRCGHDWAARMPTIAGALGTLSANTVILDGELVAVDAKGRESFYEFPRNCRHDSRRSWSTPPSISCISTVSTCDVRRSSSASACSLSWVGLNLIRFCEHI